MNINSYSIHTHKHRFAAWAACRAASVKGCRFKVSIGVKILQKCGFDENLISPDQLPCSNCFDHFHKIWRENMIKIASDYKLKITHGVAAKLINCYLKSKFVCGGFENHSNVMSLHPPIDDLLLEALENETKDFQDNFSMTWAELRNMRWSKFDSFSYEIAINKIRYYIKCKFGILAPLWKIECFWRGFH